VARGPHARPQPGRAPQTRRRNLCGALWFKPREYMAYWRHFFAMLLFYRIFAKLSRNANGKGISAFDAF
jgi:hypothetical protein